MRRAIPMVLLLTVALVLVAGGVLLIRRDDSGGGELVVRDAWTAPNEAVTAVYLTIDNGADADRLVGASADRAGSASLMVGTTHSAEGDPVDLAVPEGTTELHPGSGHLMLQDLTSPLQPGERLDLHLEFEHAGPMEVPVEVLTWDQAAARSD